jgi:hypothetical protein
MTNPQGGPGAGSLTLSASHSWMQVFLMAVSPRLVVDGVELTSAWGERTFPVTPGPHQVEVHFPYFGGRAGKAATSVVVPPGQDVRLVYRAPAVVTSAGSLRVEPGTAVR